MTSLPLTSTSPDALRLAGTLLLLVRALDQRLRLSGETLALTDISVLHQIDRGVDLPSLVARALRLDPARVTQITDRLAAKGYLERTADQVDRRCWRLHLTEAGAQRLDEGRAALRTAMGTLLDGLSEEEQAGLVGGLEGARRALDAPATAAAAARP